MRAPEPSKTIEIRPSDKTALLEVRRVVSERARDLGFGLVEHTKLIAASSELTRNIVQHAGAGRVTIEELLVNSRSGMRLMFEDEGPGIANVDLAMQDGYTTAKGMGMGLPGAKRLAHEFSLETAPGKGTRIVIVVWKR